MFPIKVYANDLVPGMIASNDVYCSRSGVLLLKSGKVFYEPVIRYLKKMEPKTAIFIDEKLRNPDTAAFLTRGKTDEYLFDGEKKLQENVGRLRGIPPETVDRETKEIYIQAYKTINKIYENRKIKPYIKEILEVIDYLIVKISVNPEMLLQIALLRKIENYCLSHSINVCVFAAYLGKLLGMDDAILKELSLAGIMHDIGKLDISPDLLKKKGTLTEKEFERIKLHSMYGFIRLASAGNIGKNVLNGVLQHHERSDGSGYPHGLKENEIFFLGKVLGIVDVFDAVTSKKSYRDAVSQHEGLEILLSQSLKFDQKLLNLFIKNIAFYPIGSRVLLNSGEIGTITGIHRHIPFRPIVTIQGGGKRGGKVVDLSEQLTLFIKKILLD